jgi:hypothetical protein
MATRVAKTAALVRRLPPDCLVSPPGSRSDSADGVPAGRDAILAPCLRPSFRCPDHTEEATAITTALGDSAAPPVANPTSSTESSRIANPPPSLYSLVKNRSGHSLAQVSRWVIVLAPSPCLCSRGLRGFSDQTAANTVDQGRDRMGRNSRSGVCSRPNPWFCWPLRPKVGAETLSEPPEIDCSPLPRPRRTASCRLWFFPADMRPFYGRRRA